MEISRHREKLAAAAAYFANNTQFCGITKLCKLLYFLDFIHFRQTGRTVTNMEYRAWPMGPVPVAFWDEVKYGLKEPLSSAFTATRIVNDESPGHFTKFKTTGTKFDHFLTKREKKIMQELAEIYASASAPQMVDVTHMKNTPWDKTIRVSGKDSVISPELAWDGTTADQLDRDELAARAREFSERVSQ